MAEDLLSFPEKKTSSRRLWIYLPWALVGAFFLFMGVTGFRIVRAAAEIPVKKADAIIVFGAAEYAGRPSPVYRARLDHAFDLFKKGMAPVVIKTGGAGQGQDFSEGGVGGDYLARGGVIDT